MLPQAQSRGRFPSANKRPRRKSVSGLREASAAPSTPLRIHTEPFACAKAQMKSEEEVLEKLSLLTLCHEIQHYIQDKQNRLGEPLEHLRTEELELEAESIGSKCLLNFKQHGNLNGIKDLLAI